jgi:hypothetical protein
MNYSQKMGGSGALINATAYVVGFAMAVTLFAPILDAEPDQYLAFLTEAQALLYLKDIGVVVDLYSKDPAQAATVWLALSAVENALGGGIELPGGLWALLVSWAALQTGQFPKALNYLGLVIGLAGILTLVPALGDLAAVFGLGFIVWFVWVGILLLRSNAEATA